MLKEIRVAGLGPHEATVIQLNPRGTTEIRGPSEAGKSFLLESACVALGGIGTDGRPLPVEALRDGSDKCEVVAVTAKGSEIRRTATRKGSKSRTLQKLDEAPVAYPTDAAFSEALGPLGNTDLRLVMAPLSWRELSQGNARPLRDFLTRILPPADLRAEVEELMAASGFKLRKSEPVDEKSATELRRLANSSRDTAAGRLEATVDAAESSETTAGESPDASALEVARAMLEAASTWEQYEDGAVYVRAASAARAAALEAQADWDDRAGSLPALPSSEELEEAAEAADASVLRAREAVGAQKAVEAELAAIPVDDVCPTCARGGWEAAATLRASRPGLEEQLAERKPEATKARALAREAAEALTVLRSQVSERSAAETALGDRPTAQPEPEATERPEGEPPAEAEVEAARAVVAEADRLSSIAEERARASSHAMEARKKAATAHAKAVKEAAHADALVAAVRRAPSIIAEQQSQALGELGPVSLLWGEGTAKSPAVTVLLDGRPWELASTGREIVGDLWFRAALRRAMRAPWLGLWVDRVQDVGGQELPEVGGPLILLRTTDGGPLTAHDIT